MTWYVQYYQDNFIANNKEPKCFIPGQRLFVIENCQTRPDAISEAKRRLSLLKHEYYACEECKWMNTGSFLNMSRLKPACPACRSTRIIPPNKLNRTIGQTTQKPPASFVSCNASEN